MTAAPTDLHRVLASPLVRLQVARAVARRVPEDAAKDVVQAVFCDALAARRVPSAEEVPRWLFAIARNKVADFHRKRRTEPLDVETIGPEPAPAATIDGRWHGVRVDCPSDAPLAACRAARFARFDIRGRTGTIEVGGGSVALDIDDLERVYHAHIIAVGNTLRVESDLGGVTLERD